MQVGAKSKATKRKKLVMQQAVVQPRNSFSRKREFDCKERICSHRGLEGSMIQRDHGRFRKASELEIARSSCSVKGKNDRFVLNCSSVSFYGQYWKQNRWSNPAQLFLPGVRTGELGLK